MIQERDDHPTASDIFEAARLRLPGISFATVYNSLRYLKEAGLVYEIKHPDQLWIGRMAAMVGVPPIGHQGVFGKFEKISLLHVVQLEPMPREPPPLRSSAPSAN